MGLVLVFFGAIAVLVVVTRLAGQRDARRRAERAMGEQSTRVDEPPRES